MNFSARVKDPAPFQTKRRVMKWQPMYMESSRSGRSEADDITHGNSYQKARQKYRCVPVICCLIRSMNAICFSDRIDCILSRRGIRILVC